MSVAVLIPALNEEGSIGRVVEELQSHGIDQVVVCDNGSTDRTPRVAADAGARIAEAPVRGYGRACLAGIDVLGRDPVAPDVVLFVDGDGADELSLIPDLLEPIRSGRADFVIGRRVGRSAAGSSHAHARLGGRFMLGLARIVHGMRAGDLGPFRAIRWETLQSLEMDDPTWGWTLQMQLRAHHLGARVVEVEVPRRARTAGRSKVSGSLGISIRAGLRMGYTIVREWAMARGSRARRSGAGPNGK